MLGQTDTTRHGLFDEIPGPWRLCIEIGANFIIAVLLTIGLISTIGDAQSRDLMVGRSQHSLVIICREDYDVEELIFAMGQGTFEERWAHLTETRRCGEYFANYKVIHPVSTYGSYTIVQVLHDRGIGYSYTAFEVVAENRQFISDVGGQDGSIIVVGQPFDHFAGLHACAEKAAVDHLLSLVREHGMEAFHTQLQDLVRRGVCGSYTSKFAVTDRLETDTYAIEGQDHEFTTVVVTHWWEDGQAEFYTFTNRTVMTLEEYTEYLATGPTYDS
jgi:hypothetical protein